MKNKTRIALNIIGTICVLIVLGFMVYFYAKYEIARSIFDDEGMFIYGFDLVTFTCVMIGICLVWIVLEVIWSKKKGE